MILIITRLNGIDKKENERKILIRDVTCSVSIVPSDWTNRMPLATQAGPASSLGRRHEA